MEEYSSGSCSMDSQILKTEPEEVYIKEEDYIPEFEQNVRPEDTLIRTNNDKSESNDSDTENEIQFKIVIDDNNKKLYECGICKRLLRERSFKKHYALHSGEFPYQCMMCRWKALNRNTIAAHMLAKHQILVDPQEIRKIVPKIEHHIISDTSGSGSQKRSAIWLHFTAMSEDKAECSICRSVYSYKGGTTSNLRKHLKTKHPTISFERSEPSTSTSVEIPPLSGSVIEDDRSSISSRCETQIVPIVSTSFGSEAGSVSRKRKEDADLLSLAREQKISNAILRMIATDLQPFSIVQDNGFRELLHLLEPSYEIPSRSTFSNSLLTREYSKAVAKLRALLNATENVCLTIDAWTSVTNDSYVGVTAHFITQNWIFYSCLLDCFCREKDHSAFHLCNDLRRVASEWGLSEKVYAITTDSAANMVESIKLTGWTHIPCFAHTVNVIVQNGLRKVELICSKVKNIVQYFNGSTQATNSLISIQEQMNQNIVPLKLKDDVPTRWNSTYSMLERVFKLQQPITATINSLHTPVELLSEHEWITIKEVCKVLEPFEQITNEMSSETAVTLSKVILIVRGLETFLKKLKLVTTTTTASTLIDSLLQSITNGFPYLETNSVFAKCDFLDPRFKKRAFATEEAFEKVKDEIHQEVTSLTNKNTSISQTTELRPEASEPARESSVDIIDLVWQDFDVSTRTTTSINVIEKTTLEIRSYIEDVPLERKQNPLEWWKTRELLYPNLSKLAKKYLSAVATSVPSERLFSKAGLAISDRRSRLKGKNIQKILFLHYNQHLLG